MKCAVHAETEATGFCRNCGKPMCPQCTRGVHGVLYCEECLAALVAKPQPASGTGSPVIAAILGWVPGLGAVYNGEYIKGLIHVVIFAGLIALLSSGQSVASEVFLSLVLACFIVYMPIEAYRTAREKQLGQQAPSVAAEAPGVPAPAPSTVVATALRTNWMVGPAILIGLGVLFLLANFGWLAGDWLEHFWPVFLIALGVWLLWCRVRRTS